MQNQNQGSTENIQSKDKDSGPGTSTQAAHEYNAENGFDKHAQHADSAIGESGKTLDKAKETASALLDQAKSAAGDAYDSVAEKATATIEDQKAGLTGGLTDVASTVRRVSGTLNDEKSQNGVTEYAARYTETAAQKLEQAAKYFERTDLKGLARDVETYARSNPAIFLGGAFVAGVLAARFFKSSPTPSMSPGQFATETDHQLTAGSKRKEQATGTAAGTM